jgi:hypothetical protein
MKNRSFLPEVAFAVVLITSLAVAQTKPSTPSVAQSQKQQFVEVTKEDFLNMPQIVSTSLSTFGVRLGMTRQESLEALKSFCPQCSIKNDAKSTEIEITVQNTDNVPAFSIHFEQGDIDQVQWLNSMVQYLAGQSRKLLTPAAFTKDSALRLELLGREDNATRSIDDTTGTSLTSGEETFVYGKEGLRLEIYVVTSPLLQKPLTALRVYLVRPARVR